MIERERLQLGECAMGIVTLPVQNFDVHVHVRSQFHSSVLLVASFTSSSDCHNPQLSAVGIRRAVRTRIVVVMLT